MTNKKIHKKLSLSLKDLQSAKTHLGSLHSDDSNIEAAVHHLDMASQDLLSLFVLLPEDLQPSLMDLQDNMGFRVADIRRLQTPPQPPDAAYKHVVDKAYEKFLSLEIRQIR
jgi:hypothetical protein